MATETFQRQNRKKYVSFPQISVIYSKNRYFDKGGHIFLKPRGDPNTITLYRAKKYAKDKKK